MKTLFVATIFGFAFLSGVACSNSPSTPLVTPKPDVVKDKTEKEKPLVDQKAKETSSHKQDEVDPKVKK